MAAKFFTGLPLAGPDPECVMGYGADALAARGDQALPKPSLDHSHAGGKTGGRKMGAVPVMIGPRPDNTGPARPPVSQCHEHPLADVDVFPARVS